MDLVILRVRVMPQLGNLLVDLFSLLLDCRQLSINLLLSRRVRLELILIRTMAGGLFISLVLKCRHPLARRFDLVSQAIKGRLCRPQFVRLFLGRCLQVSQFGLPPLLGRL